jgi:hypothetical protein
MADPNLHGNGYPCHACELQRQADREGTVLGSKARPLCNNCQSTGRIANLETQIVSEHVAWARIHYWKENANA